MSALYNFFVNYGLAITGIAVLGIVLLGILKYTGIFKRYDEKVRHILYLAISVMLSIIGTVIYTLCTNTFEIKYIASISIAIYTLNQAAYNLFCTVSLKDLFEKVMDKIVNFCKKLLTK